MLIFIRNGKPDKECRDGPLSSEEPKRCRRLAKCLIKAYGKPDHIFSSPYQQCLETAEHFNSECKIGYQVEKNLCRYVKEEKEQTCNPKTLAFCPPVDQDKKSFLRRSKKILYAYHELMKKEKVIWIIGHGQNLDGFAKHLKVKMPDKKPYLFSFCLSYQ